MTWTYWAGYGAIALISARALYSKAFEIDYEDSTEKGNKSEEQKIYHATRFGLYFAWLGLIWPIAWTLFIVIWFITRPTSTEKDLAKKKAARLHKERVEADVAWLRKWFGANKMEAPDTATLNVMAEERVSKNEDLDKGDLK